MSSHDLIIVGGGIAGLRVGIESLKRQSNIKCCILEKYGYMGGRVVTFRKNIPKVGEVQWENGAGRISTSHKKVLHLMKKYNLTFVPNNNKIDFINEAAIKPFINDNYFYKLINDYLDPIATLSNETLAKHTLGELFDKTLGYKNAKEFYEQFAYYSEIHDLRADLAIDSFKAEMGTYSGFGKCKEGLSAMIDGMTTEFIKLGGTILLDIDVKKITPNNDTSITIDSILRNSTRNLSHTGKNVVLALHHNAMCNIEGIKMPVLQKLKMTPLLRMYAIFPCCKGISWFSNLSSIVTNSIIRYIIPIDSTKGIIMISYTDGQDAQHWINLGKGKNGEETVKNCVMTEIRKLFPDITIPNPIFFKQHIWYDGETYWLPGLYDVEKESTNSLHPMPDKFPNLFVCSESFAVKQCWMESALDQADKLLNNNAYCSALRV